MTRVRLVSRLGRASADDIIGVAFTDQYEQLTGESGSLLDSSVVDALRAMPDFRGAPGDMAPLVASVGAGAPRQVLAVGVGSLPASAESLRMAAMALGRASGGSRRVTTTLVQAGADTATSTRAVTEGFLLGAYRFDPPSQERVVELSLLVPSAAMRRADVRRALRVAEVSGDATSWVRSLVDTPAGDLTPQNLADAIRSRASTVGVKARVWSVRNLQSRQFGGTLGVGSGSAHPPAVVELTWGSGRPRLGLTGKGVTFDSGGLNLKRDPTEIRWMKSDMAGAAAVAGAVCAAASLEVPGSVRAVLPLAENVISERSLRPGDVVTHPDQRRTEVLDTDSEGRLLLADAIAYLSRSGVDEVIDVGTLTDAGGLGHLLWGCFGNDHTLVDQLLTAGHASGDPGWAFPLPAEYRRLMTSDVGDVANVSREVPDSAMQAASYLSTFADGVRWVHIDNGSNAYLDSPLEPWPRGATGSPTRALLEFLLTRLAREEST